MLLENKPEKVNDYPITGSICDLCNLSYYHVYFVTDDDYFRDFPVNNWVASFMVYALHGTMILQSGVSFLQNVKKQTIQHELTAQYMYLSLECHTPEFYEMTCTL